MQQTDSRNKFLTLENTEMDTNFIQIDQIFHEVMQFLFYHLVAAVCSQKQKNANCSGPNHSYFINFFLTDAK